jgi:integrase
MYTHPVTRERVPAGRSFESKAEATRWLANVETDLARGDALSPSARHITLGKYSNEWLAARRDLRPKTQQLYSYLFRQFIEPSLGGIQIDRIDASIVRRWYGELATGSQSQATVAKAYRLLRQLMAAAVDDRLVRANPCSIKGASSERSPERQVPGIGEVWKLADAIRDEYRLMVLLAAFAGLRRGECFALRRASFDRRGATTYVSVAASRVYLDQAVLEQPPKTSAGVRRLALPALLASEVEYHLKQYVDEAADSLVFAERRTGDTPTPIVWRRAWSKAKANAGVDCTFHDLRHVAGTLNASAGASIRESMARLGHASPRAALRYQHVVDQRDDEVAASIDRIVGGR